MNINYDNDDDSYEDIMSDYVDDDLDYDEMINE
jgi:hypothetical protein